MAKQPTYSDSIVKTSTPSTSYNATTTTPTGFLEFQPRDMETQTKYDAMSPSWQGVESSMKAVERGDYALDSAETKEREKRPQYAPSERPLIKTIPESLLRQPKPPGLTPGTCVIQ